MAFESLARWSRRRRRFTVAEKEEPDGPQGHHRHYLERRGKKCRRGCPTLEKKVCTHLQICPTCSSLSWPLGGKLCAFRPILGALSSSLS